MKEGINIPVTVDAKDLPYEMDKAVSVVERATKGMSKSLGDAVKESGFHYKSLQEAYSTTVRHAELLAVTLGEDSKAYKDAVMQAQNYATKMQGVQNAIHNSTSTIGKGTGQLNMAMAQLTREAPAFTYSMTTGFMAISNNIPILVDEINRLKIANQGLAASGQATKSVFSTVVGALFSWQTALSLGITVLTVFGAKIAESITSNDDYSRSIDFIEANTRKLTDSVIDQTGELYKRNEQLRISLNMAKYGTLKDEEIIKINNEKIAQAKKLLYENDLYNSTQLANLEAGQKAIMLTKWEVKATQDKIFALETQNTALQANINLEKQLASLKGAKQTDVATRKLESPIIPIETIDSMKEAKKAMQGMINSDIQKGWDTLLGKTKMNTIGLEDFVKMADYTEVRMRAITQTLTTSFNAVGVAIGDAFATGDFGGSALKFLADFMAIVGSAAIAVGVAYQAMGFSIGQGIAAVGAGVALIAASRVVGSKAGGSGGGGGMTSSNVNSQGFQGGAYQFAPTSSYLDVSGLVRGQDIVIATNNTNRNNRRVRK